MIVEGWIWAVTIIAIAGVIVLDLVLVDSSPHVFGTKEAVRWVLIYVGAAAAFGVVIFFWQGGDIAAQFYAGYLTEYSLSVDNLFVFLVLMTSFVVPPTLQHRVLLIGVVIALILRFILIIIGAALISKFIWVFFIFGAFLAWTAWHVWSSDDAEPNPKGNALVRFVRRHYPTSDTYEGHKLFTQIGGKRALTPMFLVVIAIGSTDLLFALDSIPAVFGLTKEAYIVFTVNAFALMGLRQLYFLLHGMIDRLIYLNKGLAIILAFIAVKLVFEALHGTFHIDVPEFSVVLSLGFIVIVLAITAAWSLIAVKRDPSLAKTEGSAHPGTLLDESTDPPEPGGGS